MKSLRKETKTEMERIQKRADHWDKLGRRDLRNAHLLDVRTILEKQRKESR